jgi:uncharacterized protein YndB with AHSA1/START domain
MMFEKEKVMASTADREIITTRVFDAPRELVYAAFTDPVHISQWWGPRGFTTTTNSIDVRPGGVWRFVMHGPDGVDWPNKISYTELVKPERLVYLHSSGDEPDPSDFETIITLAAQGNKTLLTMKAIFQSAEECQRVKAFGAVEGGQQTLERLAENLTVERELVITRVFDAPRELVWKAWTEAERLAQWWGPKGFTMHIARLDFRPGGLFHYSMRAPAGQVMWGRFDYLLVDPTERCVFVNSFSDEAANIQPNPMSPVWPLQVLNTLTLSEQNGKTTLTLRGGPWFASAAERQAFGDAMSNIQTGFKGTFEQLDEYLAQAKMQM